MQTHDLLTLYVKECFNIQTDFRLYEYDLNGSIIKVRFRYKKRDEEITELDIKYGTQYNERSEEVELLDYITFVSQLKV